MGDVDCVLSPLIDAAFRPGVKETIAVTNIGKPVTRPEKLSGVWEAPDGRGGAVGLHLVLSTTIPASARVALGDCTVLDDDRGWSNERSGPAVESGEENWLSDSPRGGGVRYEGGRMSAGSRSRAQHLVANAGDELHGGAGVPIRARRLRP